LNPLTVIAWGRVGGLSARLVLAVEGGEFLGNLVPALGKAKASRGQSFRSPSSGRGHGLFQRRNFMGGAVFPVAGRQVRIMPWIPRSWILASLVRPLLLMGDYEGSFAMLGGTALREGVRGGERDGEGHTGPRGSGLGGWLETANGLSVEPGRRPLRGFMFAVFGCLSTKGPVNRGGGHQANFRAFGGAGGRREFSSLGDGKPR